MLTTLSPEDLIPADHPIRRIRKVVEVVLAELDGELGAMYARTGRPSVPPEHLLKASLLIALYSIRSERAFCERLNYDLLFKWFLDLHIDDRAFDASTFSKNRERLLSAEIADRFFGAVVAQARLRRYTSSEHFSVDGTLIEAWASMKSFVPKDGDGDPPAGKRGGSHNAERDFHGEKRKNDTHSSTTDPDARLFRKGAGKEAKLCHMGHLMTENRNGLIVDARLTEANGTAERATALDMIEDNARPGSTIGGDKNYDTAEFVAGCRDCRCTPHVSQNDTNRRSAIDARTTRHPGYRISTIKRKRIEEPFGWMKTVGGGRKLRYVGKRRNRAWFVMTGAVYNIIRIVALESVAT